MRVLVQTIEGVLEVDTNTEEVVPVDEAVDPAAVQTGLPRVIAAAASGSTVIAVVDSRPPLLVSYDAGQTWHEGGRGLPPGFAVAVHEDDPDAAVYAARNRLYVSRDGGRFWESLAPELPDVEAVAIARD